MGIQLPSDWETTCREKVKTMADAIRLLHSVYRGWCLDEKSDKVVERELQLSYAGWMLDQMKENADAWPVDKLNRWLGFVQAILVMHGVTSVSDERNRTRPIFHTIYHREGIIPPSTTVPVAGHPSMPED